MRVFQPDIRGLFFSSCVSQSCNESYCHILSLITKCCSLQTQRHVSHPPRSLPEITFPSLYFPSIKNSQAFITETFQHLCGEHVAEVQEGEINVQTAACRLPGLSSFLVNEVCFTVRRWHLQASVETLVKKNHFSCQVTCFLHLGLVQSWAAVAEEKLKCRLCFSNPGEKPWNQSAINPKDAFHLHSVPNTPWKTIMPCWGKQKQAC